MRLSKAATHAILSIAFLSSRTDNGPTQARQIAAELGVPTDSALKVLQQLVRGGLLSSQLGRGGGYVLERPPGLLSVLEVIEAVDGPVGCQCSAGEVGDGLSPTLDRLEMICRELGDEVRRVLGNCSIAELVEAAGQRGVAAGSGI